MNKLSSSIGKTLPTKFIAMSIGGSSSSRIWYLLIVASFILQQMLTPSQAWMPDVRPDLQPKQDKIISRFFGNTSDFFKILDNDDDSILVGARDVIYNISLNGLREQSRLEWFSSDADRELCALKGKSESDCHNYLRVFAKLEQNKILVCGTNSYKPRCRHYAPQEDDTDGSADDDIPKTVSSFSQYDIVRDVEAQGLCPYSPAHNSTYVFAENQLYSATVADFSGSDPLIYRENLRTEQYDLKQLNQPDFVGAIEYNGYVMFFFREIAMEYMNFGKTIYSRVGRICKNDKGGPYTLSKSWTSFLKARLNCSMPGDFPFYFDELQAISPLIQSSGSKSLIYAVFTTSVNAIPGAAVCAFEVDDIMQAFEGRFKSQKDSQSQWLPIHEEHVPEPRPGKCVDDSRMLSSIAVNFAKNHPLMNTAVSPVYGRPLLTKVNLHHRLTSIAVDSQVVALDGKFYDVVYTGTDDGKITKFINIPASNSNNSVSSKLRTVVISELQVLPLGTPVRELMVSSHSNTLLVVSDGSLVTVPLHHCAHIVDCLGCLSLQDPNCAWDSQNHECKSLTAKNTKLGTKSFLQSLNSTKKAAAALCPKPSNLNNISPTKEPHVDIVIAEQTLIHKKHHYDMNVPTAAVSNIDLQENANGAEFYRNDFNPGISIDLNEVDSSIDIAPVEEQNVAKAGTSLILGFTILSIVFIVGVIMGLVFSNRFCKTNSIHDHHRNLINSNTQFHVKHHNNGKDINLLQSPNHYSTSIHQKKPNLDLEKDRSHECKNSTENLEKELPMKTSTLTKVKRTYI